MVDTECMKLSELKIGETATIVEVGGGGALRQHFLDMGVIPNAEITLMKQAPMSDPLQFLVHGYELTLRIADADKILVTQTSAPENSFEALMAQSLSDRPEEEVEHPGFAEGGRFHEKAIEQALPEDTLLTFALAGNQNCGKTTLFNQMTGANQHVGNFPGVTVDRKDGAIRGYPQTNVTDLPGIYSMSPYSSEEIVSREFILNEKPHGIINIVDATNIERNLYLTMQLMELGVPMVCALNMMDELQGNGGSIRVNLMEEMLGIPVVPISAVKNQGVEELIGHALHAAKYQERPRDQDFCGPSDYGGAVHRCLHAIMHLVEDHAKQANLPLRFVATKLIEGDTLVADVLHLSANEQKIIEQIISQMEEERGLDRAAAIADMRFTFIRKVTRVTVVKPQISKEHERSNAIDKVLTGKWTAIPAFIAIMATIFVLTFNYLGPFFQDLLERGFDWLSTATAEAFSSMGINAVVESLVLDGIYNGVGTVLLFLPIIVIMFFFLSLLEDTGYMARIAFVMDKLLRKIGLSGRSIVPMLIGFGCTVPAVMATRTLPSERDRNLTILLTPFMSCSAKLAIYAFFVSAFFPGHGGLVMVSLYLLGIVVGIITASISHHFVFKGEAVPFVMELPNYRMPSAKNIGRLIWDKSWDFLSRAFSVIFVATIIVWFLQTFDFRLVAVSDPQYSMLAGIASGITPLFEPLGFGDWRIVTALIAGFMAKEIVVAILSVLFGGTTALLAVLTPLSAFAFLVFCLLYTPCVAAIASIRRELGWKWAGGIMVFQCVVAWVCAFLVRAIGLALGFT